jgi:hypothetical protein
MGTPCLSSELERFLIRQNIERYRMLLHIGSDPTQHRQIQNLLSEEEERAKEMGHRIEQP